MRHQRDVPCQVSLTNVCMRGILEREIGQPVVDSVDSTAGILKPVRTKRQILGIADHAVHAMVPKRVRVQLKLGVKELRSRSAVHDGQARSEEHTSELQSLMRISYAVFCLKKKKK